MGLPVGPLQQRIVHEADEVEVDSRGRPPSTASATLAASPRGRARARAGPGAWPRSPSASCAASPRRRAARPGSRGSARSWKALRSRARSGLAIWIPERGRIWISPSDCSTCIASRRRADRHAGDRHEIGLRDDRAGGDALLEQRLLEAPVGELAQLRRRRSPTARVSINDLRGATRSLASLDGDMIYEFGQLIYHDGPAVQSVARKGVGTRMGLATSRSRGFQFRRDRVIGDSQVRVTHCHVGVLELHDGDGSAGTGFFFSLVPSAAGPGASSSGSFRRGSLAGARRASIPAALLHRIGRPRGGNIRGFSVPFEQAINQALWDLHGKALGLAALAAAGRTRTARSALYASGLDFHLSRRALRGTVRRRTTQGYRGFKIKVGHPDVAWDLHRLRLDQGDRRGQPARSWSMPTRPGRRRRRSGGSSAYPARGLRHPVGRGSLSCATISRACARSGSPCPRCWSTRANTSTCTASAS